MNHKIPNILVVDDVSVNRKLAGGILAGEFLVDTVKSGREALDFFTKKLPDLVLLEQALKDAKAKAGSGSGSGSGSGAGAAGVCKAC